MNKLIKFLSTSAFTMAVLFIFSGINPADAASFMKIADIKGEASDSEHKDWIIIESMSSPLSETAATGATSGRQHKPLTITKAVDKASPMLQRASISGKVFPKVEIHIQTSNYGGSRATYLKYELKNVKVTSYQTGGSAAGDVPMEEISLNYESIKTLEDKPKRAKKKY